MNCYSWLFLLTLLFGFSNLIGQSISLDECYTLARKNYPAVRKTDLINRIGHLDMANANTKFLPRLTISGHASYQSEVIDYAALFGDAPLPGGIMPPVISRDQYRIQAELSQLLYDGGQNRFEKEIIHANQLAQESQLEAELYAIRNRIQTAYFSILLVDARLQLIDLSKSTLQQQLRKIEAAIANGMAWKSQADELRVELLLLESQISELESTRRSWLGILALFTDQDIPASVKLEQPEITSIDTSIRRPELNAFNARQLLFSTRQNQLKAVSRPDVSLFLQGAYGRPTLNMLKNEFGPWYVAGLRLQWPLAAVYTVKNKREIFELNRLSVDAEREVFLLNTRMDIRQQQENIRKYERLIEHDEDIIVLRVAVTAAAEAQLESGVITVHDYIQKHNAEHAARLQKQEHQLHRLLAMHQLQQLTGN